MGQKTAYGEAILQGFEYLLDRHPEVFVMGQGLWSPWYVGNTMRDLDKKYGIDRVMDTPVSEDATTAIAVGASLCGYRPIVVHPRVDFMLLASNAMVNQAAKWSHMLGGQAHPAVTIRGIVNRGGEQGAQHSQALHSWYAHIPGLRVVMPALASDARDLLIASVLCNDPVLYIDDRWCYEQEEELGPIQPTPLECIGPRVLREGSDLTLVGSSFSTLLNLQVCEALALEGISVEVVDLRVINPLNPLPIVESVQKTGRLVVTDGSWRNCGLAGEVVSLVSERLPLKAWKNKPVRITLPDAPAPTSKPLEADYYTKVSDIVAQCRSLMGPSIGRSATFTEWTSHEALT
jgi:pyruvate dehydrogenase E1 component beta subunit